MAESIYDYALRVQDRRNGLAPAPQQRDVILEVLAEVDLPAEPRQRLLQALREKGVI